MVGCGGPAVPMGCGASTSASAPPLSAAPSGEPAPAQPVAQSLQASASKEDELQASASKEDELLADAIDSPATAAMSFTFASSSQQGKSITMTSSANGLLDPMGSLVKSESHVLMNQIDLGQLHAALKSEESVSKERFTSVLKELLSGTDSPSFEVIAALFRVFDAVRYELSASNSRLVLSLHWERHQSPLSAL